MPEELPTHPKKHRVIAWQPAPMPDPALSSRRLPRWAVALGAAGGVLLLALTVLVGFVAYKYHRLQVDSANLPGVGSSVESVRDAFVSRSRAEIARQSAIRGMEAVRRSPVQHPVVIQRLVGLERAVIHADKAFGDARYGLAMQLFDGIANDTKALTDDLEDMRKAREGYSKFLVDLSRLESFKDFEPDGFERALTAAGASQTFVDEGNFNLARTKIEEATGILATIDEALKRELEANLAEGRQALSQGDGAAAREAFAAALELQPGNETAVKGLARAKTIEQVFALLAEADRLEQAAALEDAGRAFEQAFALDDQSATAQAGIARIKASIRQRDFEAAVNRARDAREAKDYKTAIAAFLDALKIVPDDKDVERALAEARVLEREAFIQNSLAEAYALERAYQWDAAQRIYLDLLGFEPGQPDAEEGLVRTSRVIRALLRFNRQIEEARSLAQRANFQSAIQTFNEAMASKPAYLTLTPEQEQLKLTLERESRPVQVSFISDSKTSVTIQGVQILGRFNQISVSLLPGNYEIIGRRKGYDEAREIIRVRSDEAVQPVTIIASRRMSL